MACRFISERNRRKREGERKKLIDILLKEIASKRASPVQISNKQHFPFAINFNDVLLPFYDG
jgi:hypothetical protein